MNRCKVCIYPDTRPDSHFVDGICSACHSHAAAQATNWPAREMALKQLIAEAKDREAPYDCVVPVSGGKDSTYQVIKMLELGAKVLAVNGATDMLSDIGRRNLDNLKRFCDVIEVTPNIEVRKKLVRIGLYHVGDPSWPEHNAIWSIPTRMAVKLGIPLVVWGEQPQREYATPEGVVPATELNAQWVSQFGGMLGLRLNDLVGNLGLTKRDLEIFRFPSDADLIKAKVKGIWLGDYIPWDGAKNALIAGAYGFEQLPHKVEQSVVGWENVDNYVTCLRDWLRFLKYGYARATDIISSHVRRGRLARDEAINLREVCERFPQTSLGKPISEVLAYFDLTVDEFIAECDRWTNPDIFAFRNGKPLKHNDGTPILIADGNAERVPAQAGDNREDTRRLKVARG